MTMPIKACMKISYSKKVIFDQTRNMSDRMQFTKKHKLDGIALI